MMPPHELTTNQPLEHDQRDQHLGIGQGAVAALHPSLERLTRIWDEVVGEGDHRHIPEAIADIVGQLSEQTVVMDLSLREDPCRIPQLLADLICELAG
jgi:hypothetical protein